jgi:hypothetical protein
MRVTNGIPLGSSLLLPVDTVNCVATLKVGAVRIIRQPHFILHSRGAIMYHTFAPLEMLPCV